MEYLSLYDYLGKPAGEKLGLEVAAAARSQEIEIKTKQISNPKFTGTIFLYPRDFLDFHFRGPGHIQMENEFPEGFDWTGNINDDELPF
jgi:hypothetical protein